MSLPWLKNMVGMELSDEEMADIPRPDIELLIHVTTRTEQAGSLLGCCIAAPIYYLVNRKKGWQSSAMRKGMARMGVYGLGVGLVLGPVFVYSRTIDHAGYFDRWTVELGKSYRLRHNNLQLITDRFGYVAAPLGLIVGGLGGVAPAIVAGLIGAEVYKRFVGPPPKKIKPAGGASKEDAAPKEDKAKAPGRPKRGSQTSLMDSVEKGGVTGGGARSTLTTLVCDCACHHETADTCRCFDRPLQPRTGEFRIYPLLQRDETNCPCTNCHERK